ncbi:hypothetical protein ACFY8X_01085 [Streptomyces tanashiensis]|uniref:hypothetical protein n=1 Tax=Streptomyces tanashiensis TaxID=67367 RepID=UPI00167D243A|nr:hypothetical protein [Streptomyces tanashiensis]GGY01786.1 hypothetical protein GCM10010299_00470 [Streptomyces tanashiensis]
MVSEAGETSPEPGRPVWVLNPLESIGPLHFGMSADEVRAALPEAFELNRFSADPFYPDIYGLQLGFHPAVPAVYAYFEGTGRLFCVAADAAHGPRVILEGLELTGRVPAVLEATVFDLYSSPVRRVSYGPRGNPGVDDIGMVLRVQDTASGVMTRPVLVGREWADRCTDDWEGSVPECEWLGRQWCVYEGSDVWPPPGYATNWPSGWTPPF